MAAINIARVEPAFTIHGGPPHTRSFIPLAAQTFVRGTVLELEAASGKVKLGSGPVPAANTIVGVAAEDALDPSGVLKSSVLVWLAAYGTTVFYMNAEAGQTLAQTALGTIYGINFSATAANTIDVSAGTVARGVQIVGFHPGMVVGTDTGILTFVTIEDTTRVFH